MPEQDMQEQDFKWKKVDFPRAIMQKEAKRLCKYLAFNLEGECDVSLRTEKYETFGQRFQEVKPQTLDEIPLIQRDLNLSGSIHRIENLGIINFVFPPNYDRRYRYCYKELDLSK